MLVTRFRSWRLPGIHKSMTKPETQPAEPKPGRRPFQFSLAELFAYTTLIATGLSLLRYFPKAWPLVLNLGIWITAICIFHRFSPLSSNRTVAAILLALILIGLLLAPIFQAMR